MNNHHIDEKIIQRDGPFVEFKQDTSVVSVELESGEEYPQILLLYPNKIIGMKGAAKLPFDPSLVTRVFQTNEDLSERANKGWIFN